MPRLPRALAIVAAIMLVASSAAHSLVGWASPRGQLAAANAPASLIGGLAMGWHFAGLTMLVLGVLLMWMVAVAGRGAASIRLPLFVIGGAYLLFGVGCAAALGWDNFLLVFLLPGALLLAAAVLARPRAVEGG